MAEQSEQKIRKLPQALEAEAAVLGAMLLNPETVPKVIQQLGPDPDHFYLQPHRKVYQAILSLFDQNTAIDLVTVTTELKRMKQLEAVGGVPFVSGLLDSVLTTAYCEEHAKLVLEKSIQRQLIQTATEIVQNGYDEGRRYDELLDEAEQKIFDIRQAGTRKGFAKIKKLLMTEMERIEKARAEKKLITGVETGFHDLDEKTSGIQAGELAIVAGRPSMGKTSLALNITVNAATRNKIPVAIFSLEMSTETLVQRLICSEAGITMNNLRRGMLSKKDRSRLSAALGPLYETQIYIDDTPSLTALEIRARARRLRSEVPLGLIIIDYLQLMEAHGGRRRDRNRQQEISEISRSLKAMAKELDTPVMALSQLSRLPERRETRKPQLADLRESGAIEQDADLVLLLYRPEFYHPEDESLKGNADVIIAKQRNGPLGTIKLAFFGQYMRFENRYRPEIPEPEEQEDYLPE
ncbi:replicative DNA helicase [candidate division WOR-3 bacterium JGI_Cruoil_03_51_56]|uniref:Replicative DNA helicase n=1 Tax=candidate division WOR-3 bacterium JGI_Cruoil_03_51_56 TaxID=1973747 RepID=A0A235BZR5_UNCW3|nr:MAG: replicative DNA helicase [candidate division WOR-3 bacterium JGI_Cruoil_03_51_56]